MHLSIVQYCWYGNIFTIYSDSDSEWMRIFGGIETKRWILLDIIHTHMLGGNE